MIIEREKSSKGIFMIIKTEHSLQRSDALKRDADIECAGNIFLTVSQGI